MNRIAEVRKEIDRTQSQLAHELGWRVSRIGNYELGLRTPGLTECRAIVKALNHMGAACSLEDVFPPES